MKKKLTTIISSGIVIGLLGCTDIVIKVNKKNKDSNPASGSTETQKSSNILDIEDVFSYFEDVDRLKTESIDWLTEEISNGTLRDEFRGALRSLRDSIVKNATIEHSNKDLFTELNNLQDGEKCAELKKQDLSIYDSPDQLAPLIQGALLGTANYDDFKETIKSLDYSSLTEAIEDESFIGELEQLVGFEIGVELKDGKYTVTNDNDGTKTIERSIRWKVVKELDNTEEKDDLGVEFKFTRTLVDEKDKSFTIEARVADGLYEALNPESVISSYMKLEVKNIVDENNKKAVEATLSNGIEGQPVTYSRKMRFTEQSSEVYLLRDTIFPGKIREEIREATIDFNELKKCLPEVNKNNDSEDNGSDDNGSDDNGSDDNSSGDNGSDNNGSDDNGSDDKGSDDKGSDDNGSDDNGSGDSNGESGDDSDDDYGKDDPEDDDSPDSDSDNPGQNQ